jgi:hypothetical protein
MEETKNLVDCDEKYFRKLLNTAAHKNTGWLQNKEV